MTDAASPLKGKASIPPHASEHLDLGVWHQSDRNLIQGIFINEQKNTKVHFVSIIFTLAYEDIKYEIPFSAYSVIPLNLESV